MGGIVVKQLKSILDQIDFKGYKAYKELKGQYSFPTYRLIIDYVQGDPFASPSKIRIVIDRNETTIPNHALSNRNRRVRCEDYITRMVHNQIMMASKKVKGSGKSGLISIDAPGQKVIERSSVTITRDEVILCLSIGLPAQGRKVLAKESEKLFFSILPDIVNQSIYDIKEDEYHDCLILADQQKTLREYLEEHGYIAFVANGSILPRESGVSDKPLSNPDAIPFKSPKELEKAIKLPHQEEPILGMLVPKGITLIIGGGYHGKSTLLHAIEHGVYDHIRHDGREFVITTEHAYKIRAEDGRKVTNVDISPFINNLPYGIDTEHFSSVNASGSTSQAANIIETIEAGAKALLIDEDTSATNFMIRDVRMQELVAKEKEPITPFVDKVKQLYQDYSISTILVMGGSGDYFEVADQVIMMDEYVPYHVTEKAKEVADQFDYERQKEGGVEFGKLKSRVPQPQSLNSQRGNRNKVAAKEREKILFGSQMIDLQFVEQLVDESQTRMIAEILRTFEKENWFKKQLTIKQLLQKVEERIENDGLASFTNFPDQHPGELARPRTLEIAAALNRMRTLNITS